ncbi:MAG: hypothetical protein NVSMB45_00120 [Ginsengibacter sp.]
MSYKYLGPGITSNSKHYQITLKLFRDNHCTNCANMPTVVSIGVFNNDNSNEIGDSILVPLQSESIVPVNAFPNCLVNPPDLNYSLGVYTFPIDLPDNNKGYTAAYQTCCRVTPLANVQNNVASTGGMGAGSTYACTIPGNNTLAGRLNNSAQFNDGISVICQNKPITLDFRATDIDNDSLSYSFSPATNGGTTISSANINPSAPPYKSVVYINGYDALHPLGPTVVIDPKTGIISGIGPGQGKYVVAVLVSEYRNGVFIGSVYKDFIVNVAPCDFAGAQLNPKPVTCDGFTVNFSNDNQSILNTSFFWDFGDTKSPNNTSNLATPTHVYSDTGVYKYKLVVNRGQPCADSATQIIKVYPGFFGGYTISGHCKNVPIQFTDTTKSKYGIVNSWRWEFGDNSNPGDTSHLQNPSYIFKTSGTYNINFLVSNSKGCVINLSTPITIINNPIVSVKFKDSTFCGIDSIKLSASSDVPSSFSWIPLTNINNANTDTPTVFPKVNTQYIVTADAGGCFGNDTVTVRPVVNFATTSTPPFNTICEEDTLLVKASSNYGPVKYVWSPNYNIQNRDSSIAKVYPKVDTSYVVTGLWGKNCSSSSVVKIKVKPLAKPFAGPNQGFCSGTAGVQLNATGGDDYLWSPSTGLSNNNISNPFATPTSTTTYVVSVGVTGCSKKRLDSLVVLVRPHPTFTKTNDTLMCSIDTLQLNANAPSGGTFTWTPNYNIINPNGPNPLIYPKTTARYYVTLTDPFGCVNNDSVLVNVKQFVTIDAGPDSGICRTDIISLNPTSDALHYKWSPSSPLNNDTAKYPLAQPLTTTLFRVIANIGKCQSSDSVLIKVAPYPLANAGPDVNICYGDSIQLHVSGGSSYLWRPAFFLDNATIANPIAFPQKNSRYVVKVTDTLGCSKPTFDTVFIFVAPKIYADAGPSDTSIVALQPLQLLGTGGISYLWSPPTGLNNPTISNPIATLSSSVTYLLKVSNAYGCSAFDSIRVRVYTVEPSLYVPNAFTPNSNGRNDLFRPIAIGIKRLNYFKIFNRWGQLMFSTTEINKGWDGIFNGKPQDAAVYVWIVQGVDFNDKVTTKKGTVTLIR